MKHTLDELLEPRLAKAVRRIVDTRRIARDIKRMKAAVNSKAEVAAKIRRDASTVFNLVFPPLTAPAEHMDAMLRCPPPPPATFDDITLSEIELERHEDCDAQAFDLITPASILTAQ